MQEYHSESCTRKMGQPTQTPRLWAGAKCILVEVEGLSVLTTQMKWDRVKKLVIELSKELELREDTLLDFKCLEKAVGFLCHITC